MVFRARCEACGKVYRVPSAGRAYACKACGSALRVSEEPALPESRGEAPAEQLRARASGRRRGRSSTARTGWILAGGLLAVAGIGYGLYESGVLAQVAGAEEDLDIFASRFAEDWGAGDLDALADWFHPEKRPEFRATLESIRANRGWAGPFPPVITNAARVVQGTQDEPELGISRFVWSADRDSFQVDWQFEPSRSPLVRLRAEARTASTPAHRGSLPGGLGSVRTDRAGPILSARGRRQDGGARRPSG